MEAVRILHRILATNDLLLKCGINQDNLCTFCKRFPEKIEHLFWYCNTIMEFWENIENWIYEKNQYLVNIDKKRAIFGICNQNEFNKPINYILILRFLSTLLPFLQVIAHHIQDKLTVSFDSSSIGLISNKCFLTIYAKYSSVKTYNEEDSIFLEKKYLF